MHTFKLQLALCSNERLAEFAAAVIMVVVAFDYSHSKWLVVGLVLCFLTCRPQNASVSSASSEAFGEWAVLVKSD